jgi:hypothetical protein
LIGNLLVLIGTILFLKSIHCSKTKLITID